MIPLLLLSLVVTASDRKEAIQFPCGESVTFHVESPAELDGYIVVIADGIEGSEITAWHEPEVEEERWNRITYKPIKQSLRWMTKCGAEFLVFKGEMRVEWEVK